MDDGKTARVGDTAPSGEVDRAFAGVQRAIDRLVKLSASEDLTTQLGALTVLRALGEVGVRCLIAALDRAKDDRLRTRHMRSLALIGQGHEIPVTMALFRALEGHEDDDHRAAFLAAAHTLGMRTGVPPGSPPDPPADGHAPTA